MTDQPTPQPAQHVSVVSLANLPKTMTRGQLINSGSGKRFDRIWRLEAGQPIDPKNRAANGKFYVTRKVRDPQDREKKIDEYSVGIDTIIRVIPLAYGLSRDFTVYHNDTKQYEQFCHSDNFFTPDMRFAGEVIKGTNQIAHKCAEVRKKVNAKTGIPILDENGEEQFYVHKICPFANFGEKNPATGKNFKPKCDVVYTIYFAVKAKFADPDNKANLIEKWVACEISMKVMQANMGAAIIGRFGEMEKLQIPLSTYPLQFEIDEYIHSGAVKNSYVAKLITTEENDPASIDKETFEALSTVVADTIAQRKKWAAYDPNEERETAGASEHASMTTQPEPMDMQGGRVIDAQVTSTTATTEAVAPKPKAPAGVPDLLF